MSVEPQPNIGDQIVRFMNKFAEEAGRAIIEWAERNRAALEALGEFVSRPEVRAALEQYRTRGARREYRPCHCLCGKTHPADSGICDMDAVTTRHYDTELIGPVDVPLCAPCAAAQFVAEIPGADN